ncbi:MAG: 4-hydroxythreonine-4-phosphate dehydrogenase [Roseiarcus sp.]
MDFIFMLTRNDATVPDALELVEIARPLGLEHIGFKDVGVERDVLEKLTAAIRAAGAAVWMEVVSTTREDELASLATARALGVDFVMGGTHVEEALELLSGSSLGYLPFSGRPSGHPTALGGSPEEVEAHCRAFVARGCAGSDLLAYRATEADPIALVAAARSGLGPAGRLVVAGSIHNAERIRATAAAGADAFTIGTAAIEGFYAPGAGGLAAQLAAILTDCRSAR